MYLHRAKAVEEKKLTKSILAEAMGGLAFGEPDDDEEARCLGTTGNPQKGGDTSGSTGSSTSGIMRRPTTGS